MNVVFFIALALIVAALGYALARWWRAHRRAPGALAGRARRLWSKTGIPFSRPAYLTVHAVLGLAAIVAGLAVFARLADWMTDQAGIARVDVRFDEWLHSGATPAGLAVARAASLIGGPAAMTLLMIAGAVFLLVRRERLLMWGWLLAFAGGGALDWALKTIFHRSRPSFPNPYVHVLGYSFPSGHSMGSLIGFGMLAYVIIHAVRRRAIDRDVAAAATVLVLVVGFSRLYLGAHYLSDVLAGYAAGVCWLAACISAVEATAPTRLPSCPSEE